MKYNSIKYILFFFLIVGFGKIFSQDLDTLAKFELRNVETINPHTLQFDIQLIRESESWTHWANGTMSFAFDDPEYPDYVVSPDKHAIALVTTDLTRGNITGNYIPEIDYTFSPMVVDGRFVIHVFGPEPITSAEFIPYDTIGVKVGTFQIATLDQTYIPELLSWTEPKDYFQASAFKLAADSTTGGGNLLWFEMDDNVQMSNTLATTVIYDKKDPDPPCFIVKNFAAEYMGSKKVRLSWETDCEYQNEGFILMRGRLPYGSNDPDQVTFDHEVGRWDGGGALNNSLIGLGTDDEGKYYYFEYDSVPYRDVDYCYLLLNEDWYGEITERGRVCVPVPNAVITYAQPNPNPFFERTTIKYKVDDDVYMDINAYDVLGRKTMTMMEREFVPIGVHEIEFVAPHLASQGLYEIIFIAYPIDDPSVELSRAVVKAQLIR